MGEPRWWVLGENALTEMLQRAQQGDDPGVLVAELYANSDTDSLTEEEVHDVCVDCLVEIGGEHECATASPYAASRDRRLQEAERERDAARAQERATDRAMFEEMNEIHNDLRKVNDLLGLHYDGASSPAGWLHDHIVPAVLALAALAPPTTEGEE